jgi:hypothetical protein
MSEFDDEEIVISQYSSQQKVLWQNGYMHRGEIPEIVVHPDSCRDRGAPQFLT